MDLDARAARIAKLLEERLDVGGQGLSAKLGRAGRRLPRPLRAEAEYLLLAQKMAENPRLAARVDHERIAKGAARIEHYLATIDPRARRWGLFLDWLAANALNLVLVGALVLALLLWRGFL